MKLGFVDHVALAQELEVLLFPPLFQESKAGKYVALGIQDTAQCATG